MKIFTSILLSIGLITSSHAEVYEMKCVASQMSGTPNDYYTVVFDDMRNMLLVYNTKRVEFNKIDNVQRRGPYIFVDGKTNYRSFYTARFFTHDMPVEDEKRFSEQVVNSNNEGQYITDECSSNYDVN